MTPKRETSIGPLRISDDASATSGTLPTSGSGFPLRPFDRVVGRDVHVGGAGRQMQLGLCGNAGVLVRLGRARDVDRADSPGLFDRLDCPGPGIDVVRRCSCLEQVHRHHRELQARATLEKQDSVVRRHARQLTKSGDGTCKQILEHLRPMADLHHRHSDTRERNEIALRLLEHREREERPGLRRN